MSLLVGVFGRTGEENAGLGVNAVNASAAVVLP